MSSGDKDIIGGHRYEPLHSPTPCHSGERVKFKVGDEGEPLMKDDLYYNDMPRPSLASFITSAADLSRPSMSPYFEKRPSAYFDKNHDRMPVFVELFDLQVPEHGGAEWEETARWIKYEEDVEGVDHHWGRPHVAFLAFHSLIQLRHCFSKGLLLLDIHATGYDEIRQKITEAMKKRFHIDDISTNAVLNALGQNHRHVPEHHFFFKSLTHHAALTDVSSAPSCKREESSVSSADKKIGSPADKHRCHTSDALPHVCSTGSLKPKRLSKQISFLKTAVWQQHGDELASTDVLRKVPQHAECAQVFVGALNQLKKVRFTMVRLATATTLPELLDAPIPIRFMFIILGPTLPDVDYHELGRSIATLMTNEHFKEIAYTATTTESLLLAIDDFVDESIVVPPGEIDHRSLISVDDIKKALRRRKKRKEIFQRLSEAELSEAYETLKNGDGGAPPGLIFQQTNGVYKTHVAEHDQQVTVDGLPFLPPSAPSIMKRGDPLQRTGRFFGGLLADVKCRYSIYRSDFSDALHFQTITSLVFMFFAAFSPAIGFGGLLDPTLLLGEKTNGLIGTSETLMAQCVCGIVWGLFSCQPMLIMAATGPVLVFEASLWKFCDDNDIEFLVFRVWVAVWVLVVCLLCVMLEGSFMVRYVTRFTEDIFATLIPLVFVYESLKFLVKNFIYHPLQPINDYCLSNNISTDRLTVDENQSLSIIDSNLLTIEQTLANVLPRFLMNVSDIQEIVPLILASLMDGRQNNSLVSYDTNVTLTNGTTYSSSSIDDVTLSGLFDNYSISDNATAVGHHRYKPKNVLKNQPDTALLSAILLLTTFLVAFKLRKLRNSYFFGRTLRRAIGDFGVPIAILFAVLMYIIFFRGPYLQHLQIPDSFSTTIPSRGWFISPWGIEQNVPVWTIFAAIVPALFVFILFFVEIEITQSLLSMKERGLRKSMGFHFDLALLGVCTLLSSLLGLPWMCSATVQSLTHCASLTIMKRHAPGERAQVDRVLEQRVTTIGIALLTGASAFLGFLLKNIPLSVLFGIFLYLGIVNMLGVQFLHRLILVIVPQKYYPDYPYCQQVSMWRMHFYTFIQLACLVILWICKSIQVTSLAFPFVLMLIALFRKFVMPHIFQCRELDALDGHAESDKEHEEDEDFYSDAGWPM